MVQPSGRPISSSKKIPPSISQKVAAIRDRIMDMGAKRFLSAVLCEKIIPKAKPLHPDYCGFSVPDRYVFGCGMDVSGVWRNLPAIYAVKVRHGGAALTGSLSTSMAVSVSPGSNRTSTPLASAMRVDKSCLSSDLSELFKQAGVFTAWAVYPGSTKPEWVKFIDGASDVVPPTVKS